MTDLTATERQLAKKLGTSKHPDKTLERAVKENQRPVVLWRLLAAGALEFRGPIAGVAGCCAERAKLADVWKAVHHLDDAALREESVIWALGISYREHAKEWERELPNLPRIAHQLVAGVRHEAGESVEAGDREHVLETWATAAVDKQHTNHHRLQQDAELLGESNREFGTRVLRHLELLPADARLANYIDVLEALRFAPWDVLAPLLERVAASDRNDTDLLDMLGSRDDSPVALLRALDRAGEPLPPDLAVLLLVRARIRGEVPPPELDPVLVEGLAEGWVSSPEATAALEALPAARRDKLAKALKATRTEAYSCAGLLRSAALDKKIIAELVACVTAGLEADDPQLAEEALTPTLASLLGAGEHGIALIDRALAKLAAVPAFGRWYWAADTRLLCRRVQFLMTRGRTRRLELVMPGDDLERVSDIRDAVGHADERFAGLTPDQIAMLHAAWAPYGWDGGLYLDQVFGAQPEPPSIEKRPWRELADLVAVTSFQRLARTEALPRVFDREDSLAHKLALAERIAKRANVYPEQIVPLRAIMQVLAPLLPHVTKAGKPLDGELERAAKAILAHQPSTDVRDLLLALPLEQVTGWLDEMRASTSTKLKRLATAYAKLLPA